MLFPIGDDDRGHSGFAFVTITLLVLNIGAFVLQVQNPEITYAYSVVPEEITTGEDITEPRTIQVEGQGVTIPHQPGPSPIYLTLLTAMFLHGGIGHLFGNMLYLWIFGDNVEHRFGHGVFLLFYLVSGLAASAVQIALNPESIIPNLGASGAISGILGAYIVLFPRNKVYAIFIFRIITIPAAVAIGLWILFQLYAGWAAMAAPTEAGGVAYGAHVGGFFAGALLALVLRMFIRGERRNPLSRAMESDPQTRRWW
jgi:membrane associated rhomboid family serine protease